MKLKTIVKLGFDVRTDGIYNKRNIKVAENVEDFTRLQNKITSINSQRTRYFRQHNIKDDTQAYGGDVTNTRQLADASKSIVNAVKNAVEKRTSFRKYVTERDETFMDVYRSAIERSGLSEEEKYELYDIIDDMTPSEFASAHRNDLLPNINEFDSDTLKHKFVASTTSDKALRDLLESLHQ